MDSFTYHELEKRISDMEVQLGLSEGDSNSLFKEKNIETEVKGLEYEVQRIVNSNESLGTLIRIIEELDLWETVMPKDTRLSDEPERIEVNSTEESNVPDSQVKSKLMLIEARLGEIEKAKDYLTQFSQFDVLKLCNYLSSGQEKAHNYNADNLVLLERRDAIRDLTKMHYTLLRKTMVILEKYCVCIYRQNKEWQLLDQKLLKLSQKARALEDRYNSAHKY